MNPVALTACLAELEKIAAHMKEAGRIHIPQALQGLVRPEMGPRAFREILEGYRTGMRGVDDRAGKYVRDRGFLTHDTRSSGGLEAMEDALRDGTLIGSLGGSGTAQYTRPGLREVYWHRGFPNIERDPRTNEITRMWFRGPGAEGFHVDQGRLARGGVIKPDTVHRLTGGKAPAIARTPTYDLQPGDLAVLSAAERKNLPEMLARVKDRGLKWSDSSMQQEALRQAQLERYFRQKKLLDPGEKITDLDDEDFADLLEEALKGKKKGSLPRTLRWWRSAKAPTTSNLEQTFMERLRKPYE
jgi:hypothetical protein